MTSSAVTEVLDARALARLVVAAATQGVPLVSLLVVHGPTVGRRAVVRDGQLFGSLGDELLDAAAREIAQHCAEPSLHHIGAATIFAERIQPMAPLLIVGAGHIAVPLAGLAVKLDFAVTVLDDREEFARDARFDAGVRVLRVDFANPFEAVALTPASYVVLVTRAHKYDYDCLKRLLERPEPPAYIGMIGSRRRVRAAFHALTQGGVSPDRLARVRAPIGVDIGAETPAEIAVSIAAELIRERAGRGSEPTLSELERVQQRFFPDATHG